MEVTTSFERPRTDERRAMSLALPLEGSDVTTDDALTLLPLLLPLLEDVDLRGRGIVREVLCLLLCGGRVCNFMGDLSNDAINDFEL